MIFKKLIKIVVAIFVVIILIGVFASPDEPEEVEKEPSKVVSNVVEEKPVEEVVEPTEESDSLLTDEEIEYATYTSDVMGRYSDRANEFGKLMLNPTYTDEWVLSVVTNIIGIKEIANEFLEYGEPPAKFTVSHSHLENAMREILKAMDIIPTAIDNGDVQAMQTATEHINKSGEYVKMSNEEMQRLTDEIIEMKEGQ